MVEVVVGKLGVDAKEHTYVVFLQEKEGTRVLPIWIGQPEAAAIVMELQHHARPRPLTHDLCRSVIVGLGGELRRVQITKIEDRTYFAELHLMHGAEIIQVDARPSDAIAIALRCGAPIFAADMLLTDQDDEGDYGGPPPFDPSDVPAEQLKAYLERLRPEDFGKFNP